MAKYVVLDAYQIYKLLQAPNGLVYNHTMRLGNQVLREARRRVPKDTAKLAQSLTMEMGKVGKDVVARVGTNIEYGLYVHEGTANNGTGYIYPKNAKVLKFPVINNSGQGRRRYKGGATAQYAYAKRVKGVKARPFLRDALNAVIR